MEQSRASSLRRWIAVLHDNLVAGVLLLACAWVLFVLVGNPGYFSHDELQWAARAQVNGWSEIRWVSWLAIDAFQYRPLTFNAWLVISRILFDYPEVYHLFWCALGLLNAGLLYSVVRALGVSPLTGVVAAAAFWINPYSVFVHAWVATLADLLWLCCALVIARVLLSQSLRLQRPAIFIPIVVVLTVMGLAAKEAALSIPAMLFAAALFHEDRRWRQAFIASAVVAGLYLLARINVLIHPAGGSGSYGIDLAGAPRRFLAYQLFPVFPWSEEIHTLLLSSLRRVQVVSLLLVGTALLLFRSAGDWLRWLLFSLAALGPALLIASSSDQYGYGLGAVLVGIFALHWRGARPVARGFVMVLLFLCTWHGINVARHMRRVGDLQAVYSPALVETVVTVGASNRKPLVLDMDCEDQRWVYTRLTDHVPGYHGVPLEGRVTLAAPGQSADRHIDCSGRIYSSD